MLYEISRLSIPSASSELRLSHLLPLWSCYSLSDRWPESLAQPGPSRRGSVGVARTRPPRVAPPRPPGYNILKYFTFIEIFYIYWNILHLLKYFPCSQQPCPPQPLLTLRCSSTSSPGTGPHHTEVQQGQKPIRRGRKPLSLLNWFCW